MKNPEKSVKCYIAVALLSRVSEVRTMALLSKRRIFSFVCQREVTYFRTIQALETMRSYSLIFTR